MIGLVLALLLGGAQGPAPAPEAWTPATFTLIPAVVLTAAPEDRVVDLAPDPLPAPKGKPKAAADLDGDPGDLMPAHLEKAWVRPGL